MGRRGRESKGRDSRGQRLRTRDSRLETSLSTIPSLTSGHLTPSEDSGGGVVVLILLFLLLLTSLHLLLYTTASLSLCVSRHRTDSHPLYSACSSTTYSLTKTRPICGPRDTCRALPHAIGTRGKGGLRKLSKLAITHHSHTTHALCASSSIDIPSLPPAQPAPPLDPQRPGLPPFGATHNTLRASCPPLPTSTRSAVEVLLNCTSQAH